VAIGNKQKRVILRGEMSERKLIIKEKRLVTTRRNRLKMADRKGKVRGKTGKEK
jgi:hypothetical protein